MASITDRSAAWDNFRILWCVLSRVSMLSMLGNAAFLCGELVLGYFENSESYGFRIQKTKETFRYLDKRKVVFGFRGQLRKVGHIASSNGLSQFEIHRAETIQ